MIKEINIENLKCDGCSTRIINQLRKIKGVIDVQISLEEEKVAINFDGTEAIEEVKQKLLEMGYPERGTIKGLKSVQAVGNSFASCMLGRFEKINN